MSDKIQVTGYGATAHEARVDAERKMSDAKMDHAETALAGGAVFLGGNLLLTVVGGYLSFLWFGFLSFAARPLVTMIFCAVVFGLAYLVLMLFGITGWESLYRENPFKEFFVKAVAIVLGSGFAGGVAAIILPVTKEFEEFELNLFRKMPNLLRMPIMVALVLWPMGIPVYALAQVGNHTWEGVMEVFRTWPWYEYSIIAIVYLVAQGVVLYARLD